MGRKDAVPGDSAMLRIIDAHQHFWDLDANHHPWLRDPEPIPFRYDACSALHRNYFPADDGADAAGHLVWGTVHMEAEFDPAHPVAETEWLERLAERGGLPSTCVAQAQLDDPEVGAVLAGQAARFLMRGLRVDSLAGSFDAVVDGFLQAATDRSEAERRALLHDNNAARINRL
ncbi:hypothetical protein EBE87_24880 [Pseudoroseomonas wenyumeiae]|uniref:Amidohydrolase n=1 Tax=Teichococcus wenyumeiae TaxID=2478470 RepID=A0A3A9JBH2_9PROT|nr:hypothetical protein [Pseudoroseomonas wenyumeiae]RKK03832.1 hypothetical protein D6Z83_12585 [Pseudoroseomonas wenyumeiae]RMI16914.1 hypothetical protein EBE87_24880 [Pseudoroseomonas wenyumeiae]